MSSLRQRLTLQVTGGSVVEFSPTRRAGGPGSVSASAFLFDMDDKKVLF